MRRSGPPAGVDPADLLAEQMDLDPSVDLDVRLDLAPDSKLSARSVVGWRLAKMVRAQDWLSLVAASLVVDDGQTLPRHVLGLLTPAEFARLRDAVWLALQRICPTYALSDVGAWQRAFETGCERNTSIVIGVSRCADTVMGMGGSFDVQRPERYWGRPVAALYDGQLMAYRAVHTYLSKHA